MHRHLSSLQTKLRELMARYRVPGVAVGILDKGQEFTLCEGITHIYNPLEITRDTLFQIASNTKTMTGVLLMQLVDEGKLNLDAPVKRYLPELELADSATTQKVSTRQLLNHTGGWVGDLFADTGDGDDALARYVAQVKTMPQITALGSMWHYNNAAFGIAGRLVEVLTDQPFETAMRERLFKPLGMTHSNFFAHEAILERHCVGHYQDAEGRLQVSKPWAFARAVGPIGRVNSSVRDMLRYARLHLGGGLGVISDASVKHMQEVTTKGQLDDEFGVTWWLRDLFDDAGRPVRMILHGGAANGQMSAFWLIPSMQFACCILTNSDKGSFLHRDLSSFIQQTLGLGAPEPKQLSLSQDDLGMYQGRFVGHAFGTTIRLYPEDDALMHQVIPGDVSSITTTPAPPLPPARCAVLEGQRLLILEGDAKGQQLELLEDSNGEPTWLRSGGRLYAKQ
jgi:CubicO group peptidase (beta-lactamase class C family)